MRVSVQIPLAVQLKNEMPFRWNCVVDAFVRVFRRNFAKCGLRGFKLMYSSNRKLQLTDSILSEEQDDSGIVFF